MKTANSMKLALHLGAARASVLGPLFFLVVAVGGCHSSSSGTDDQTRYASLKADDDLDGGSLDGEEIDTEAIDAEAVDTEAIDAEAVDTGAVDVEAVDVAAVDVAAVDVAADAQGGGPDGLPTIDGQPIADVGTSPPDVRLDVPGLPGVDGGGIDSQVDGGVFDAGLPLDVGSLIDVQANDAEPLDGQSDQSAPGPDLAQPNADTAIPITADAAPTTKADAAGLVSPYKALGGGFCAISSSGTTSPAAFLLLALAGLALLRRRR
jgi:MYXO-CTERM domain-containing protein